MNKKLLALLLAGLLVAAMTACTDKNPNDETNDSQGNPEDSYIVIGVFAPFTTTGTRAHLW